MVSRIAQELNSITLVFLLSVALLNQSVSEKNTQKWKGLCSEMASVFILASR